MQPVTGRQAGDHDAPCPEGLGEASCTRAPHTIPREGWARQRGWLCSISAFLLVRSQRLKLFVAVLSVAVRSVGCIDVMPCMQLERWRPPTLGLL
jgi:hypothetical protein